MPHSDGMDESKLDEAATELLDAAQAFRADRARWNDDIAPALEYCVPQQSYRADEQKLSAARAAYLSKSRRAVLLAWQGFMEAMR